MATVAGTAAAVAAPQIIKGPYLQQVTSNSIVVMWETDTASDGQVTYGTTPSYEWGVTDSTVKTIHEIPLTGLKPNAVHYYKVSSGGTESAGNSFITAPASSEVSFRFAAYGDTRSFPTDHQMVVQQMIPHQPDFVLHVGDFVNSGRIYSEWGPQYFTPAADLLKNTPLFGVLGNHEYTGTEKMWYYDFFAPPDNGSAANKEHWYVFTYGAARFIGLNACEGGDSFLPGSEQYQWLVNEFNSTAFQNARWQFVWMHNPPYTAVERDNVVDQNLRAHLVPLFEQYGVDVVFSGDDHFYRHSLRNGIHYIITGGGGAPLHAVGTPMSGATLIHAESTYEACILDLTPTTLDFYAAKTNGMVIDSFSLNYTAAPPAPTGLTATPGIAQVSLTWIASPGATSYNVKRATASGGPYAEIGTSTQSSYSDTSVANGTAYYYVVSAVSAEAVESANSFEVTATPVCPTPSVPSGLQAVSGNAQVALSWSASSGATEYVVKRGTSRRGPYTVVGSARSTSFVDSSVQNGTTYYYVVSALNECSQSGNSSWVSAMPQAPLVAPPAPTDLTAVSGPKTGQVKLTWTASAGAASYKVWRSLVAGGSYSIVKSGVTTPTITDSKLNSGTTYFYVVTAVNTSGESPSSNESYAKAK